MNDDTRSTKCYDQINEKDFADLQLTFLPLEVAYEIEPPHGSDCHVKMHESIPRKDLTLKPPSDPSALPWLSNPCRAEQAFEKAQSEVISTNYLFILYIAVKL